MGKPFVLYELNAFCINFVKWNFWTFQCISIDLKSIALLSVKKSVEVDKQITKALWQIKNSPEKWWRRIKPKPFTHIILIVLWVLVLSIINRNNNIIIMNICMCALKFVCRCKIISIRIIKRMKKAKRLDKIKLTASMLLFLKA